MGPDNQPTHPNELPNWHVDVHDHQRMVVTGDIQPCSYDNGYVTPKDEEPITLDAGRMFVRLYGDDGHGNPTAYSLVNYGRLGIAEWFIPLEGTIIRPSPRTG